MIILVASSRPIIRRDDRGGMLAVPVVPLCWTGLLCATLSTCGAPTAGCAKGREATTEPSLHLYYNHASLPETATHQHGSLCILRSRKPSDDHHYIERKSIRVTQIWNINLELNTRTREPIPQEASSAFLPSFAFYAIILAD
jgi:hypothetical protein